MNQINGVNFSDYGLKLINYENLLNMPSRIGSSFYNWGDEIEPLIKADHLNWGKNVIKCRCFFDSRDGYNFEDTLIKLRELKEVTLTTSFGDYDTTLISVDNVSYFSGFGFITINFEEEGATFSDIPAITPSGGAGFSIDGFNFFDDLGIIVSETKHLNNVPEYQISNETVYKTPKKRTNLRKWGTIKARCVIARENAGNIEKLKYLLSTPELKKLSYQGFTYDCFLSKGFQPKFSKSSVEFSLELNVGIRDATISVYGNGVKIANNDQTPSLADHTHYGQVDIQGEVVTRTFTIQNDGGANLSINNVKVTGEGFTITQAPFSNIGAGNSSTFRVSFDPSVVKNHSAIIEIENSDLLYSPFIFRIAGTTRDSNLAGVLKVYGNSNEILDGDITPTLDDLTDFGVVEISNRNKTSGFILKNEGTRELTIESVSVTGSGFSNSDSFLKLIEKGGQTALIVTFDPDTKGFLNGTVSISWKNGRDATVYNHSFSIKGEGATYKEGLNIYLDYGGEIIPHLSEASSLYGTLFPDQEENSGSITRSFNVTNAGAEPITEAYIIGSDAFTFETPIAFPVTGDQTKSFSLRFAPLSDGNHTASLVIKTETHSYLTSLAGFATTAPPLTAIKLIGKGREIGLQFNAPNVQDGTDYGIRYANIDPYLIAYFTIKNIGGTTLNIQTGALSVTGVAFSIYTDLIATPLAPNESREFAIRFVGQDIDKARYLGRVQFSADNVAGDAGVMFSLNLKGQVYLTGAPIIT